MKYGHFDDLKREYVIDNYRTPLPWINYLGSDSFFTLLSNTAGGYSFYKDARLRRITRYRYNNLPLDQDGFHIYVKDNDIIWNPGWQPVQEELDEYDISNNPVLGFFLEAEDNEDIKIENETTRDVYRQYQQYCLANSLTPLSSGEFSKQVKKHYGFKIINKRVAGKQCRIFVEG